MIHPPSAFTDRDALVRAVVEHCMRSNDPAGEAAIMDYKINTGVRDYDADVRHDD